MGEPWWDFDKDCDNGAKTEIAVFADDTPHANPMVLRVVDPRKHAESIAQTGFWWETAFIPPHRIREIRLRPLGYRLVFGAPL